MNEFLILIFYSRPEMEEDELSDQQPPSELPIQMM